jgi:4a-hydroxytetrahydrobiopterin dehydratase
MPHSRHSPSPAAAGSYRTTYKESTMNTVCDLTDKKCVPCEGGVPTLSREEAVNFLKEVPDWQLADDAKSISRRFEFKGFYKCMAFINAMAWVANSENHHPDFSAGYNYCDVTFTTHAIDGLSENDFICAAKLNALF